MRCASVDAEVGADQRVLESVERRRIELALGDEIGDRAAERRRGALEPAGQALPPALLAASSCAPQARAVAPGLDGACLSVFVIADCRVKPGNDNT